MFNVLNATNDIPTESDIFQILSLPISPEQAGEDPKVLVRTPLMLCVRLRPLTPHAVEARGRRKKENL